MKKNLLIAAVAVMVIAMAGVAFAGSSVQTSGVAVSATINAKCDWVTDGSVVFPAADSGDAVAGTVTAPTFWCTKGYSLYTISSDYGLHGGGTLYKLVNTVDAAEFIEYSLTIPANVVGAGKTTPLNLAIAASIPAGKSDNAKAGNYTDTVKLTVAY